MVGPHRDRHRPPARRRPSGPTASRSIDGGRLVELGTHAELVDAGGRYSELYANWAGGLAAAG